MAHLDAVEDRQFADESCLTITISIKYEGKDDFVIGRLNNAIDKLGAVAREANHQSTVIAGAAPVDFTVESAKTTLRITHVGPVAL